MLKRWNQPKKQLTLPMSREDAIIFRDIVGKLDVLNIRKCDRCGRRGRYYVHRLIEG
jgi:hypothetical protein